MVRVASEIGGALGTKQSSYRAQSPVWEAPGPVAWEAGNRGAYNTNQTVAFMAAKMLAR